MDRPKKGRFETGDTNKPCGIKVKTHFKFHGTLLTTGKTDLPPPEIIVNWDEIREQEQKALIEIAGREGFKMADWNGLALALAFRHEPSLRRVEDKKTGSPQKWNEFSLFFLWWDVQALKRKNQQLSVSSACEILAKEYSLKPKSLRVHYEKRAKNSSMTLMVKKIIDEIGWTKTAEASSGFLQNREQILAHVDIALKNL